MSWSTAAAKAILPIVLLTWQMTTPVPGRARVVLTTARSTYFLGEDPDLEFCVENISAQQTISVNQGADYEAATRAQRFKVSAIDAMGAVMPDPEPSGFHFGGVSSVQSIAPGAKWCTTLKLMRYVRIDRPGTYEIRATHDLGWPAGQTPEGRLSLTLNMPSAAEAERIVATLDPYFGSLRYDVYLPFLRARARAGNVKAIDGLATIPAPEATRALIDLTTGTNREMTLAASQALAMRLPDPELTGGLPPRSPFANNATAERKYLRDASWRPDFAPDVRATARRLLADPDQDAVITGAFLLETTAEAADGDALSAALTRAIDLTPSMPFDERSYPRSRGAAAELMRAAQIVASRGYWPAARVATSGAVALRVVAIGQGARPADWESIVAGALAHPTPYVREVTLDHLPDAVPASLLDAVGANLDHPDIDVEIAACRLVTRAKLAPLAARVTAVAERAKEQWLRNASENAVWALSGRGAVFAIRARRVADVDIAPKVLADLIGVFGVNGWRSREITAERARDLSARWVAFIAAHRAAIDAGVTLSLDAPDVSEDLVAPGWVLFRTGKPDWPPAVIRSSLRRTTYGLRR